MFFKLRPHLQPNEKAQVEYSWQWIADCIGKHRFNLPVLSSKDLLTGLSIDEFINTIAVHLQHNVDPLKVVLEPQLLEKCGSGG